MNTDGGQLNLSIRLLNEQLRRDAHQAIMEFARIGMQAKQQGKSIDDAFKGISVAKIGSYIGGVFAVGKLKEFASQVVAIRGQIQSLEISFRTLAGQTKGDLLFKNIREFAVKTPMVLKDLAQGAQTMLAFNIEAEKIMPILKAIGDISMGDAAKFNSLSLAFSQMSSTGKLMGQDLMQMINAGFNPLTEISTKTGKSIKGLKEDMEAGKISVEMVTEAFMSATSEGGKFYGMLEKQSYGIQGAISNLDGAIDDMMNNIGQQSEDVIVSLISAGTSLAKNYEQVGRIIFGLVGTYGAYKAALIAVTACKGWATAAEVLHYNRLLLVEKAQKMLNATMLSNPYVLVATLLAGVAAALISMKNETERVQEAEEAYENQKKKVIEAEEEHRRKMEELCSIAGNEAISTDTRREALNKLEQKYPDIFAKYDTEYEKLKDIKKIKEEIAAIDGEQSVMRPENEFDAVEKRIQELVALSQQQVRKHRYVKDKQSPGRTNIEYYYDKRYLTPDESAEYKMLIKKRDELKGQVRKNEVNAYFENLTGVSNDTLEAEIKRRQNLMARMAVEEKKNGSITQSTAQLNGTYSREELQYQLNKLKSEQNRRSRPVDSSADWVASAKKKYQDALKAYNDFIRSTNNFLSQEDFEKKAKELRDAADMAKKEYDKVKPETDKDDDKSNRDANHIAVKSAEILAAIEKAKNAEIKANRDAMIEVEQERISLMEDGAVKAEAQIKLDQKRMEAAIADRREVLLERYRDIKQKEWEAANHKAKDKGLTFNRSIVTNATMKSDSLMAGNEWLADAIATINQSESIMQEITDKANRDLRKKTTDAMNEYLAQWGQGMEKRNAIIALATSRMAAAETDGERKSIFAQMQKDVSDLDIEANKKTSAISTLFDDMTEKTVADMKKIYAQGKEILTFLESGEWNAETGLKLSISEETFNVLSKSPEEIERIRKGVKQLKGEIDGTESGFKKLGTGLSDLFKAGDDPKKLEKALGKIREGMQAVMQVGGFLKDSLAQLGEAFGSDTLGDIAEGIGVAMEAMDGAMQGAEAGAAFGPWGAAAGAAIGLVSSLGSAIAKLHDAKHEKRIEDLQDQIEVLEQNYDDLGRAVEKAYSKDAKKLIEQQNTLLRQQKQLIQNQIAEEKAKKSSDEDRIKDWEQQIHDIDNTIADNKEKAIDAIFGEDVKAAIDRFSDAYASMFDAGTSRARSSKDLVKDMIKNMIIEAMKADISEPMEKLREMMTGFWSDEFISDREQEQLENYVENMFEEQEKKWGWADGYFKDSTSQGSSKGGFTTMSQDSADELNGRFTALQMAGEQIKATTADINEQLKGIAARSIQTASAVDEIRGLQLIAVDHLETIRKHTANLAEMNERLGKIEKYTSRI